MQKIAVAPQYSASGWGPEGDNVLYALGTNIGIKRVADGGRYGEAEAALRTTRYLFVNRDNLRKAIATLVNLGLVA